MRWPSNALHVHRKARGQCRASLRLSDPFFATGLSRVSKPLASSPSTTRTTRNPPGVLSQGRRGLLRRTMFAQAQPPSTSTSTEHKHRPRTSTEGLSHVTFHPFTFQGFRLCKHLRCSEFGPQKKLATESRCLKSPFRGPKCQVGSANFPELVKIRRSGITFPRPEPATLVHPK